MGRKDAPRRRITEILQHKPEQTNYPTTTPDDFPLIR